MKNLPKDMIPDRDNVVFYDTEKGRLYIIQWVNVGNKEIPKRYYINDKESNSYTTKNDFNPDDYKCLAGVCPDLSDEKHCKTCTLKRLKEL